jgi:hypothetical protein
VNQTEPAALERYCVDLVTQVTMSFHMPLNEEGTYKNSVQFMTVCGIERDYPMFSLMLRQSMPQEDSAVSRE